MLLINTGGVLTSLSAYIGSGSQITTAENINVTHQSDSEVDNHRFDSYETIEETIERIKKDVVVTGTILAGSGQELAIFQIEGMPDRSFKINTQLMDGFIITKITEKDITLKNQIGNETLTLYVQSGKDH